MKGKFLYLCFLLVIALQSACIQVSPQPRVVISGVQTYIHPNIHEWDIMVGMFVFTSSNGSRPFAYNFSKIFHKELLKASIFRTTKFIDLNVGSDKLAIRKGREFDLDYAIYGHINEYREAMSADRPPFVSMTFRIIDVRSGHTLWYIEDSISGDAPEYKKLLRIHSSDDYPPAGYLANRLILNIVDFLADFKMKNGS